MDYKSLLQSMDLNARALYPRVAPPPSLPVEPYSRRPAVREAMSGQGQRTTDAVNTVQASPDTMAVKRYVILDTSLRDFTKQPNPYSNLTYSFGSQTTQASNPPVYSNNPFVPTFGTDSNGNVNVTPGIPNTKGWFFSNAFYPAYNSSIPNGTFIGYDNGYLIQPSGVGFGSFFTPCNVQSLRLIRAILPQRQFLNLPIIPGTPYDVSGSVQTTFANKSYSTFTTYPYLLMNVNQYFGQYVGGNSQIQRAFSVLTQKSRTQQNFALEVGVQHFDYEPWGEEALVFQSPIAQISQLQVSITDPLGVQFIQNDGLTISVIQGDGTDNLFLKCFTGSYQYFTSNDLRVGDRVSFDTITLSNILNSPILSSKGKKDYVKAIISNTFPVLQLLDYVPDSNGIYQPRGTSNARVNPYNTSYNGFLIPNLFVSNATGDVTLLYSNVDSAPPYSVLDPPQIVGSNLPFLNVSIQPVFTFELICLQPDTGMLKGGKIV
jgi:hypothetical protein